MIDEIRSVFNSLTLTQKRTALALLGPPDGEALHDTASVEGAILASAHSRRILTVLRDVEVATPKKHFFLATYLGDAGGLADRARARLRDRVTEHLTLTHVKSERGLVALLFERSTRGFRLERLPNQQGLVNVRGDRPTRIRHSVLVRIFTSSGRAVMNYPGLPTGIDYNYTAVIDGALEAMKQLGLVLHPLAVRPSVTSLIAGKGRRILAVRGDLITPDGFLRMRSRVGKASIQQLIARLIERKVDASGEVVDEPEIIDRITHNLGEHTFDAIGLLWVQERVLTRVQFIEPGPDILVVWDQAEPSFALAEQMLAFIYDLAEAAGSQNFEDVWAHLSRLPTNAIATPGEFRNRFDAPREEVDRALLQGLKLEMLLPVYRLNVADELVDELGLFDWTPHLATLARVFNRDDGTPLIDGRRPENIRIAFQRVRAGAPV